MNLWSFPTIWTCGLMNETLLLLSLFFLHSLKTRQSHVQCRPQMRALAHETAPAKAKMRGGPYIYIGWKWHRIIKKLFYSFIDNLYVSALQKDVSSMNAKPPVCEGGGAIMHGLKPAISSRRQSHFINLWYHA
jgi:hypothetical protein